MNPRVRNFKTNADGALLCHCGRVLMVEIAEIRCGLVAYAREDGGVEADPADDGDLDDVEYRKLYCDNCGTLVEWTH